MSVNLKNPEAERLLNALAELTGETLTEAAACAFRERLERLKSEHDAVKRRTLASLTDLISEARSAPALDARSQKEVTDELWGES